MAFSFDIITYVNKLSEYGGRTINYKIDCPVSELTTFKIGGACAVAVFCEDKEQIIYSAKAAVEMGERVKLLGRGSNILCPDDGYDGVIIVSSGVCGVRTDGEYLLCECGLGMTAAANAACDAGLCGAEFMYGIPGTVGGGIFMNAGAYGGEMADIVESVECLDMSKGEVFVLCKNELDFSYRHSIFTSHPEYAVLSARLKLSYGDKEQIKELMRDLIGRRRSKQPLEYPSAGSTFKRYPGYFTAQLIDEAGLKGFRVGDAQVSEKHAGFVINLGNATCSDVLSLIAKVKEEIYKKHGIEIECEVEYLGKR